MANTTFSGPVRSENNLQLIVKQHLQVLFTTEPKVLEKKMQEDIIFMNLSLKNQDLMRFLL